MLYYSQHRNLMICSLVYVFMTIQTYKYLKLEFEKTGSYGQVEIRETKARNLVLGVIWPIYWSVKGMYHSTNFIMSPEGVREVESSR